MLGSLDLGGFLDGLDMGNLMWGWMDALILKGFDLAAEGLQQLAAAVAVSPDTLASFEIYHDIHANLVVASIALLILIVGWQTFKSFFVWAGFEADSPFRIGAKAVIFGLLIGFSKDLLLWVVTINYRLLTSISPTKGAFGFMADIFAWITPGKITTIASITSWLLIYLMYKMVVTLFRMVERLILCVLLILFSPLAFAAAVSDSTKGFFQGFVRLFAGNLIIQTLQMGILAAVAVYSRDMVFAGPLSNQILQMFVLICFFKIVGRLEEIVRDMSMSVGLGVSMGGGGLMGKAQSMMYTTQHVMNLFRPKVPG